MTLRMSGMIYGRTRNILGRGTLTGIITLQISLDHKRNPKDLRIHDHQKRLGDLMMMRLASIGG